jgi:hypothetical protein
MITESTLSDNGIILGDVIPFAIISTELTNESYICVTVQQWITGMQHKLYFRLYHDYLMYDLYIKKINMHVIGYQYQCESCCINKANDAYIYDELCVYMCQHCVKPYICLICKAKRIPTIYNSIYIANNVCSKCTQG